MKNNISVPMLDLKAQHEPIKEEIKTALKEILDSGQFVLGRNVTSFEQEIAAYYGVKHAVGLASGTDALHVCLNALNLKPGDEIITTPFTFIASAESITYVGAKPVFVDIDSHTLNIDVEKIEGKITSKTRAIVVVHLFGLPVNMDALMEIAKKYNLKVIEDSAQSFGARYNGVPVGTIGDTGCFSFYPSKNLGAYGDGGMMITNNSEVFEKVRLLRNHGTVGPYDHRFLGFNSRLDEIQAAILRIKLRHIDTYNQKRREIAAVYTSLLGSEMQCPVVPEGSLHVYHQYTIRTPMRNEIQRVLKDNSISSVVYYPLSLHMQKAFEYLGYSEGDFPESEAAAREVLSLPVYPEMEKEKAEYIAEIILETVKSG